ncbi:MAG: hydrogenase expression/formation protein HypE [Anaerolineae bacterium]|nr:hydrogenase expression/formation protein HypE [Anaerolineae bacterium]
MSDEVILLAHGSGGKLSHDLVERLFLRHFDNPTLLQLDDAAVLPMPGMSGPAHQPPRAGQPANPRLAFTTDSYVVSPLFFPGGDIGKLAVCGTVNDLSMSGARPLWLSAGFIIEEGLPLADLERIVASMASTAEEAGVQIVAGDTKVVDRGSADRLFINTAGVGVVAPDVEMSGDRGRAGDVVLISGTIGDHGMTIMTQREGLQFDSPLVSDCAALNGMVARLLAAVPAGSIHCLRDPTRGGLATTLNELAARSGVGIEVEEMAVPVRDAVRGSCELLGLDPFYVANEGKLVALVAPQAASAALTALRAHPLGGEANVIGQVTADHPGRVVLRTALGARRVLDMLVGEQLPRIC